MDDQYLDFAKNLALQAGEIIRKNFILGAKREWKADGSPVTETDLAVNRLVIDEIKKKFKTHGVLGEEESALGKDDEFLWVCDPIDGTIPFSHGYPTFAFSLALVKDGEVILGVLHDPILDRLVWAQKGKGAFLNGKPISVSQKSDLKNGMLDLSVTDRFAYKIAGVRTDFDHEGAFTLTLGSVCYGSLMVASGEFIGEIYCSIYSHDIAAAKVIVDEAGGRVTDLFGKEQRYDGGLRGAIISNGKVHDDLVRVIGQFLNRKPQKRESL